MKERYNIYYKILLQATTLQTNSDAVTAAVAKMNSLAGTSRRNIRAAAASCAEVITKSTSCKLPGHPWLTHVYIILAVTLIISQSTSSSQISVIATEISTSSGMQSRDASEEIFFVIFSAHCFLICNLEFPDLH